MAVEDDDLLYEFQTLMSARRSCNDQECVEGTFSYEGNKVVVHWEPGGFTAYSSAVGSMEELIETFESSFWVPRVYVAEDEQRLEFERVYPTSYSDEWDVPVIKGATKNMGFYARDEPFPGFPEDETGFSVFSDRQSFEYNAIVADQIHAVFPELFECDVEVLAEDVTSFGMARREKLGL